MIVTKTPLRIEFAGGATDLANYYQKADGYTLNSTIDKYVYVIVKKSYRNQIKFHFETTELVDDADLIKHDFTREALRYFGIHKGIEIISMSDIHGKGSGLGSSGSYAVGLCNALSALDGNSLSQKDLAECAAHIEIDILKLPIGKQDQYAAAYGGLSLTSYSKGGSVKVEKINEDIANELSAYTLVFDTGITHSASKILSQQNELFDENFHKLMLMADAAKDAADTLRIRNYQDFARLLENEWNIKGTLFSGVVTDDLMKIYKTGLAAGAWGGRVSGAGGGGYIYFIAPKNKHTEIRKSLTYLKELELRFTSQGSQIVFQD